MISFLRTLQGEYLAVETIAKLLRINEPPLDTSEFEGVEKHVSFHVETKRGHLYEMDPLTRSRFHDLLSGD